MSELSLALDAFDAAEDEHRAICATLEQHLGANAAGHATPTLADALARFDLEESDYRRLLADHGWTGDLVVFLAATVKRIDPALRASFPTVNAFAEGAAASVLPGGGVLVGVLLALAEGPLLTLVETWLAAKATELSSAP